MDPAREKDKCCWYPFKKAHRRRRIQPGYGDYEDPPTTFYLQNSRTGGKPVEVELFQYDETASQHVGATELVLEGHPMPGDDCSLVAKRIITVPPNQLATINTNCMSQEFWVDEIVEGGPWSCIEESLQTRNQCGPLGAKRQPQLTRQLSSHSLEQPRRHISRKHIPRKKALSPLPRVEVVHEPRRVRSFGSASLLDEEQSHVRHSMCIRTNGGLKRPMNNSRKQPIYNIEIPEEKKDEDMTIVQKNLDLPSLKHVGATRVPPVSTPPRRSRTHSSDHKLKPSIFCGNQQQYYDRNYHQQQFMQKCAPSEDDPAEPSFYVEVEATRAQLNAVKDLFEVKDNEEPEEKPYPKSFSKKVSAKQLTKHNPKQSPKPNPKATPKAAPKPSPKPIRNAILKAVPQKQNVLIQKHIPLESPAMYTDLEMVRQASLVDGDSAFMDSEISEDRGYLTSVLSALGSPQSPPTRSPLAAMHEPTNEVAGHQEPIAESPSRKSVSSDSLCSSFDSEYSESSSSEDSTSFQPPHEINRMRSDVVANYSSDSVPNDDITSRNQTDGVVRNISNMAYKKAMSEKVSRRLRSFGRSQKGDVENQTSQINSSTSVTKPTSLQRQPISALTTTSDEKYSVSFRQPNPQSTEVNRVHVSELTTTTKDVNKKGAEGSTTSRKKSNFIPLVSRDRGILTADSEDNLSVSDHRGNRVYDFDHRGQRVLEKLSRMQSIETANSMFDESNPDRQRPTSVRSYAESDADSDGDSDVVDCPRSPRSVRPNPTDASVHTESIIRSPRSPQSVKSQDWLDDLSDLNTDAFQKYQGDVDDDDDDDSIFSDLQTVESSKWGPSKASGPSVASRASSGPLSKYEQARREKLFKGDATVQTDVNSINGDGAFACMDEWLDSPLE